MRQQKTDIFLIHPVEKYLNDFMTLINDVMNHPYTLPENIDNYEMYKSFNDTWHKMTSNFHWLNEIIDGKSIWNHHKGTDKCPEEFNEYNWMDGIYPSMTSTIYNYANHNVNEILRNIFSYRDQDKHYLDFTKFWNDTLKPICELFIDWVNDNEHINIIRINRYEALKPGYAGICTHQRISVWNFPCTDYWKYCVYVDTEEYRLKKLVKYTKELEDAKEKLKTTQSAWFYEDLICRYTNYVEVLEGKIPPEKSICFILNIKENEPN